MKTYRVTYRMSDRREDADTRTEQVRADGWRVDQDTVLLYQRLDDQEIPVLDVPKTLLMRIHELPDYD
ncbi:MAG: hypothetical protein V3S00_01060 [Dehalococcoidia bacterium]